MGLKKIQTYQFLKRNVEEELGTPSDHVEQHQTVRDWPTKQNPIRKTIELPKPEQTIECKLANNDFCFTGSEIFQTSVMDRLCHLFKIKSEEIAEFQYIGLCSIKKNRNVKLGQNEYKKKIKMYPSRMKQKFER